MTDESWEPLVPPSLPTIAEPRPAGLRDDLLSVEPDEYRGQVRMVLDPGLTGVRGGVEPRVSIAYVGPGGNGPLGVGWSMSVPAIRRATDSGIPRYRDAGPELDAIVHDELGDVVPELERTADGWRPVQSVVGAFEVARWTPRVRRRPVRLERWTRRDTGRCHWVLTDADNRRTTFGQADAACLADPDSPARVAVWLPEQDSDDRGNLVRYEWITEDARGVAPGSAEMDQVAGSEPYRYLKRIRWGNHRPDAAVHFTAELVIDYGDHPGDVPALDPTTPWPVRVDPVSSRRTGFQLRSRRLVRRLLLFRRAPESGSPAVLRRSLAFGYAESTEGTVLTSIAEFGYLPVAQPTPVPGASVALTYAEPTRPGRPQRLPAIGAVEISRFVDLDGTGLPGVLDFDGTLRYRANLGGGGFAPATPLTEVPAVLGPGAGVAQPFADGRTCIVAQAPSPAFQPRAHHSWGAHTPFEAIPANLDVQGLRRLDVDGDGRADLLHPLDGSARWHRFLGDRGWSTGEDRALPSDVVGALQDRTGRVLSADLTGDGLPDLVRVGSGSISYWPGLGHGRFGSRIEMLGVELLGGADGMDPRRIRFVPTAGRRGADLLYLGPERTTLHRNQAGTTFGAGIEITGLGDVGDPGRFEIVDILGTGSTCLVAAPVHATDDVAYVELDAGPRTLLLTSLESSSGLRHTFDYRASTQYWSDDVRAGTPWRTSLPACLPLLAEHQVSDLVTGVSHRTSWHYRHGVYETAAREFRGFGMVDRLEAVSYPAVAANPRAPSPQTRHTRRWYDTGSFEDRAALEAARAAEIWSADPDRPAPPAVRVDQTGAEASVREALAAVSGTMVREEVYGLDDTPSSVHPLRVTSQDAVVRVEQPAFGGRPPVCRLLSTEELVRHVERRGDDSRLQHHLALSIDADGVEIRGADIGYPRTVPQEPGQERVVIRLTTRDVASSDSEAAWRRGVPLGRRIEELVGMPSPQGSRYNAAELAALADDPDLAELDVAADGAGRRLLRQQDVRFVSDDGSTELPRGEIGRRALVRRVRTAVYSDALVADCFAGWVGPPELVAAGLEHDLGLWWDPGARVRYDPERFWQAVASERDGRDARTVEFDAAGLSVTVEHDPAAGARLAVYTSLSGQADRITAADGVTIDAAYDAFDRSVARAETTPVRADTLAAPTMRWSFADGAWRDERRPRRRRQELRVTRGDPASQLAATIEHVDGSGMSAMSLAADGRGGWVVTERMVRHGDGASRLSVNPYVQPDAEWHPLDFPLAGAAATTITDALDRVVWTEHPDASHEEERRPDAWTMERWDGNDCADAGPWMGTPKIEQFDPLGRPVTRTATTGGPDPPRTRLQPDAAGQVRRVLDPRGIVAQRSVFDLRGESCRSESADAGTTLTIRGAAGDAVLERTAAGFERRHVSDRTGRRVQSWMKPPGGPWRLALLVAHGDQAPPAERTSGLLDRGPWLTVDPAGLHRVRRRDAEGRVLAESRRALSDLTTDPDWSALADLTPGQWEAQLDGRLDPALETVRELDGRGLLVRETAPDGTTQDLTRSRRGLLERATVTMADGTTQVVLAHAEYDPGSLPLVYVFGNGVREIRRYDPRGQLTGVRTIRPDGAPIRDQTISYDAVGNPVRVSDAAAPTLFYRNAAIGADLVYGYDALDRLIRCEGREAVAGPQPFDPGDTDLRLLPLPGDAVPARRYVETYTLDASGNLTALRHAAAGATFVSEYTIDPASNRVIATPQAPGSAYTYDAAGNPLVLGTQTGLRWDADSRLVAAELSGGGQLRLRTDGDGNRILREAERLGGMRDRRTYLGAWERSVRVTTAGATPSETTLHVGDPESPLARLVVRPQHQDPVVWTFVHTEATGSVRLETDVTGRAVTFEEHRPYGGTAYRARADVSQPAKRYRYLAGERDDDLGWDRRGRRYYVAWLARWASPDPAGMMDDTNRYWFTRANPLRYHDPTGTVSIPRNAKGTLQIDRQGNTVETYVWEDAETRYTYTRTTPPLALPREGVTPAPGVASDGLMGVLKRPPQPSPSPSARAPVTPAKPAVPPAAPAEAPPAKDERPDDPPGLAEPPAPAPDEQPAPARPVEPAAVQQARLAAPAQPPPDWTTQTEWTFPELGNNLPIPMIRSLDTGLRPLNFVLNKIILPWRNFAMLAPNLLFGGLLEMDRTLSSSSNPLQKEYEALVVMGPMMKVMGLAVEIPGGVRYLTYWLSTNETLRAWALRSVFGAVSVGGGLGVVMPRGDVKAMFMRRMLRVINDNPNHPLRFLVDPATKDWWARSHLSEDKPAVQAGHLLSNWMRKLLGEPHRLAVEDALYNQLSNWKGETGRRAWFEREAVEVEGVVVELQSLEMWAQQHPHLQPYLRAARVRGWSQP